MPSRSSIPIPPRSTAADPRRAARRPAHGITHADSLDRSPPRHGGDSRFTRGAARSRTARFHGRAAIRHAARTGRPAAAVARRTHDHRAPRAHAQARRRHVDRADARVQRGSGVHLPRVADHLRGATAHDLPVLRRVRASGASRADTRRRAVQAPAHRARRDVAGRRVSGRAIHGDGGRSRRRSRDSAGGALGRRPVAGAEAARRGAASHDDRDQHVARLRLFGWTLIR